MLSNKSILITGATGSFGRQCCYDILKYHKPARVIIYSRDELKQSEMQADPDFQHPSIRFFIGDIRDKSRLERAMTGVDFVIHAAALKQVPAAEYNPHEFIKTNINGATNVVDAALSANVHKVIALSTDKATNPINLYGATKLCSDKIFIAGNSYSGKSPTRFSVVRYGNVIGSRGSVVPIFLRERQKGTISLTDPQMTRFFISLEQSSHFVLRCLNMMVGGELFVPKISSCSLQQLIEAIAPNCKQQLIGIRPGEKRHETLIPQDEARLTHEFDDYFIVQPLLPFWQTQTQDLGGKPCPPDFSYSSNNNPQRYTVAELRELCNAIAKKLGLEAPPTPSSESVYSR